MKIEVFDAYVVKVDGEYFVNEADLITRLNDYVEDTRTVEKVIRELKKEAKNAVI